MKTQLTDHPLEEFFGIESNSTEVDALDIVKESNAELVDEESVYYDDVDKEIHAQCQDIYNSALDIANLALSQTPMVEGKHKADMFSSASALLTVALHAVKEKRELKKQKEKSSTSSPKNLTNNLFVGNHSELLKMMKGE